MNEKQIRFTCVRPRCRRRANVPDHITCSAMCQTLIKQYEALEKFYNDSKDTPAYERALELLGVIEQAWGMVDDCKKRMRRNRKRPFERRN